MTETTRRDAIDPARASALWASLGVSRDVAVGEELPGFFHHIYFWEALPPERLGRDGHPAVGQGLIPETGLPRRMWAGGTLEFHAPFLAGLSAEKRSRMVGHRRKEGRSGTLVFVTLSHEIRQDGTLRVREQQDLVYRADPSPNDPKPARVAPPATCDAAREVTFDATMLFRYSALTFNGHRIHYDRDYARDVEGYAGLVVHGPLLAQMLMLFAGERAGSLKAFRFRGVSPLVCGEAARLCADGGHLWVASGPRLVLEAWAES